ncbi:ribosome biogenesis protein BRX1 homolog isoform X1 [Sinocyclocheilus anshuiensis]|uniref:ribosome biogenesis protein BRX1 homolog isoform X1 n=1 Tax=Sinocyclocheilus anshuiensis TaxID=1608454 RepID=UPI0007B9BAAD|nr:PREDICTED: uncharacterized protein LOC107694533 isoform X1 [Sinocyclocheilus anshuiensis]
MSPGEPAVGGSRALVHGRRRQDLAQELSDHGRRRISGGDRPSFRLESHQNIPGQLRRTHTRRRMIRQNEKRREQQEVFWTPAEATDTQKQLRLTQMKRKGLP